MEHIIAILSGGVFGLALDKAKTNLPFVISGQMEMDNFIMMRMFLAASASSTVAVALLDLLGVRKREARASMALGYVRVTLLYY